MELLLALHGSRLDFEDRLDLDGRAGRDSVRFVKNSISGHTWRALGTVAGNEAISSDAF